MLPVLWLYGPAGVGKTTAAWRLFNDLAADGVAVGYVDVDQVGMCYDPPTPEHWAPEPESDPGRHVLKTVAVDAVAANFEAAGARCLIVSGVADPETGIDASLLPRVDLTPVRLRADEDELHRRVIGRGGNDDFEDTLREARMFDRNRLPGECIDTTGLAVDEIVARAKRILAVDQGETRESSATPEFAEPDDVPGEILWLAGPTGVGKSSVAWQVYRQLRLAGEYAAFLDIDQVGFFHRVNPGEEQLGRYSSEQQLERLDEEQLRAANVAAVWRIFQAHGTQRLVLLGPLRADALRTYVDALPGAKLTVCRMYASPDTFAERIALRGRGHGPTVGVAGDRLLGQPDAELAAISERASVEAEELEAAQVGDFRVVTDGREPEEIAREIVGRVLGSRPGS